MKPDFPAQFGRYLLLDRIASGGMAEIFRAKLVGVEGFEKTVVIKRIHPFWSERRDFINMLVDEAKLLVHLNHPNIVQVFELGREGATYFIAMEFVEGVDLRQLQNRLKALRRPMPPEIAAAIVLESLKGLHYAHERALKDRGRLGIVHRDVSPQNILLSFEGEVKVTDFGIAKAMIQTHETQTGVLKGKYAYMSPEQAVGAPLDARSDLFACGIVCYELLFERRLFAGQNDLETLDKVRRAQVPWPEEKAAEIFPGLREVLERVLKPRPEDRFASAEDFAEALEACIPHDKRVGRRRLAAFLEEVFAEEIQHRRQQVAEIRQKTESFLRQTRAELPGGEDTVSLVESSTELEAAPPAQELPAIPGTRIQPKPVMPEPESPRAGSSKKPSLVGLKQARKSAYAAGLLLMVMAAGYGIWRSSQNISKERAAVTGSVQVLSEPAKPPVPESMPAVPPPVAAPAPKMGSLILKASPASAQVRATYLGEEEKGIGSLLLENLPPGTLVQTGAVLANYEAQAKSFTIPEDPSTTEYVFKLEKKSPALGSLRINAVPWGRVTVPGYIGGSETPVMRGKIPEGKYSVAVSNAALSKTLRATAVVRAGKTTHCHADFEGRGSLNCR